MRHLQSVLERNLSDFVGHQEVYELIKTEVPAAQEEFRTNRNKLTELTIVCHALLAEGVPITPFSIIYDQFAQLSDRRGHASIDRRKYPLPAGIPVAAAGK